MKLIALILIFLINSPIFGSKNTYTDDFGDLMVPEEELMKNPDEVQIIETSYHKSLDEEVMNLIRSEMHQADVKIELRYESDFRANYIKDKIKNVTDISLVKLNPKTNSFKIHVVLNKNEMEKEKYEINGRYVPFLEVPVARRLIKNGDVLKSEDITKIKTKTTNIAHNIVLSEEKLVGMEAKNVISSGRYFKQTDVRKPPVVFVNDVITMIYHNDNLTVKTIGVAMEEGAVGDRIKMKNEKTGSELYAKIIDKNTVQLDK
jgi:flagella basal body P-ring formation protein FlgA